MNLRRLVVGAATLGLAAAGLGVVGAPVAAASCAGPQLGVTQSGTRVTALPRTEDEDPVYPVATDQPLQVIASYLADGCQDTFTMNPGCGRSTPMPAEPVRPLSDLRLVLRQGKRHWTLARADAPGADLTAAFSAELPAGARPGAAVLELTSHSDARGSIRLQLG